MAEQAFLNDGLVDIDSASVSVKDSGFLYGAGLFETMRSYNGVVFALEDHLDRLLLRQFRCWGVALFFILLRGRF